MLNHIEIKETVNELVNKIYPIECYDKIFLTLENMLKDKCYAETNLFHFSNVFSYQITHVITGLKYLDYYCIIKNLFNKIYINHEPKPNYLSDQVLKELSNNFTNKLIENQIVCLEPKLESIHTVIFNIVKSFYQNISRICDIPPPAMIFNMFDVYMRALNVEYKDTQLFGDFHESLVKILYDTYICPFKNKLENFKYMLFADGRSMIVFKKEEIHFIKDSTFSNTFYLNIDVGTTPDSLSNLTIKDKDIIYNGTKLPYEIFESISAKAPIYNGQSLFYNSLKNLNIDLFSNLHKYLKNNGVLQLLNAQIDKNDLNQVNHIFNFIEISLINYILLSSLLIMGSFSLFNFIIN